MAQPQPRSDAYTGMLGISLAALVIGCGLLFLDLNRYGSAQPPKPVKSPISLEAPKDEQPPKPPAPNPPR